MKNKKKTILFVGAFQEKSKSGHTGGQVFACTSLLKSELSSDFDWVLIDTTANSNVNRPFIMRLGKAFIRSSKFLFLLISKKIDSVLIFSSCGYSFLEKGSMVIIAKKIFKKKTILAPRSGFLIEQIENSNPFKSKVKKILSSVDILICQGTAWQDFFHNTFGFDKNKMVVLTNWIDTISFINEKTPDVEHLNILFLGWVEENKGIFDLIEAINSLKDEKLTLTIAGEGVGIERAKKMVVNYHLEDVIKFSGWVLGDEKKKLLHKSDVLVLPSYREGLPNAMLEAMASRCAVIVSKVGGVPDVIEDGENGFLIDPGNPNMIADKIRVYLANRNIVHQHAEKALNTVTEKCSIKTAVSTFKRIL